VLSFAFKLPTPITLAAAVIASLASMDEVRDVIIELCETGELYLNDLEYYFDDNPDCKAVEVRLPFLEFVDEGYRIIQENG